MKASANKADVASEPPRPTAYAVPATIAGKANATIHTDDGRSILVDSAGRCLDADGKKIKAAPAALAGEGPPPKRRADSKERRRSWTRAFSQSRQSQSLNDPDWRDCGGLGGVSTTNHAVASPPATP